MSETPRPSAPLLFVCSYPGADGPPNPGPGTRPGPLLPGSLSAWDGDERVAVLELAPAPSYGAFSADGRLLHLACEGVPGVLTTVDVESFLAGAGPGSVVDSRPSGGSEPCHLSLSPSGRRLAVANYASGATPTDGGVLTVFPIGADGLPDGPGSRLALTGSGPDPMRQPGSHAHQAVWLDEDRLLLTDLGADAVLTVAVAADGTPSVIGRLDTERGAGPRHLVLLPGGGLLVAEELAGRVSLWLPDADGHRQVARVATVPAVDAADDAPGATRPVGGPGADQGADTFEDGPCEPSAIVLAPGGTVAHIAVRGPDVVSTVAIAVDSPEPLRLLGTTPTLGNWPRDLLLETDRLWVANQGSSSVVALALDPSTHRPGHPVEEMEVTYPNWLARRPG